MTASTQGPSSSPLFDPPARRSRPGQSGGGGGGGLAELPPFSFGGVIRLAFSGTTGLRTNIYPVNNAVTVTELAVTLAFLDRDPSDTANSGPKFRVIVNGAPVYTSPRIQAHYQAYPVTLPIAAGALVYILIPTDNFGEFQGYGYSAGLSVVMRL